MCVELATAQGLAEVEPVGGAIAGAAEARGFAEGFQQDGPEVVAAVPVGGQAAFDLGEQVRGKVRDTDLGQDQEAGMVDDPRQVALAHSGGPADKAVAGSGFQAAAPKPSRTRGRPSRAAVYPQVLSERSRL